MRCVRSTTTVIDEHVVALFRLAELSTIMQTSFLVLHGTAYIVMSLTSAQLELSADGSGWKYGLVALCFCFHFTLAIISRPCPRLLSCALCLEWINGMYNTPDTEKIDRKHINCRNMPENGHDICRENSK